MCVCVLAIPGRSFPARAHGHRLSVRIAKGDLLQNRSSSAPVSGTPLFWVPGELSELRFSVLPELVEFENPPAWTWLM